MLLHDAKADAGIGLDFPLKVLGELLIALIGHDRECVHLEPTNSFTRDRVHAQAQPASYCLPAE